MMWIVGGLGLEMGRSPQDTCTAGLAEGDVLAQIVALEHDSGVVGGAFGSDPVAFGVDGRDPPVVAVADLVDLPATPVARPGHTAMPASYFYS
jgi:hypothetical protein